MGRSDAGLAPGLAGATPSCGSPTQSPSVDAATLPLLHLPRPHSRATPIHGSSLRAPSEAVSSTDTSDLPKPRAFPWPAAAATRASLRTPSRGTPAN
eukprot:882121-Pyramimonas_sp.AAC.1